MKTISEIISKPVLNLYTGKIEGTIHNVVFDKEYKKVQKLKLFDNDEEEYIKVRLYGVEEDIIEEEEQYFKVGRGY